MKLKLSIGQIAAILVIVISFIIGAAVYPKMPDQMASHWGPSGEVDGYMSKFWGVFFMPILSLGLYALLTFVPQFDPKKKVIETFKKDFDIFLAAIFAFLLYIYVLTLVWNTGIEFNMVQWLLPALGMLFYECGILIGKSKQNYTIGIRTPWTLASENVWNKTHKLGEKLFKAVAILSLIGIFIPSIAIWVFFVPIIAATITVCVYSYLEYKKEKN